MLIGMYTCVHVSVVCVYAIPENYKYDRDIDTDITINVFREMDDQTQIF